MNDRISPRSRVLTALSHKQPDRLPVDFLATPEIWERLIAHFGVVEAEPTDTDFYDASWEAVLRALEVDCRVISYDQFCFPPAEVLRPGASVNWWDALSRSTPNRMWRQVTEDGDAYDIWGHHLRTVDIPGGAYEEYASWPLESAETVDDLKAFRWPEPRWWNFEQLPELIAQINREEEHHIRFRAGSVFELAWQLRGMERFLLDLALAPEIPTYIMTRITEVLVENIRQALAIAGDQLDMVYFYDDVATQDSLLISPQMWAELVKPHHQQIIDAIKSFGKPVMYHCDGALRPLLPELVAMGIDVLNPIQAEAPGMDPADLKSTFGTELSFHGGIDIIDTLPRGSVADVRAEVEARMRVLGQNGGYIMASSHHIQSDTPVENVLAMYDVALR
jgi:uroporphyrinogen decarboxylase